MASPREKSVSTSPAPRLVVLASGRGSNAWALWRAIAAGELNAELVGIVSNMPGAPVLQRFDPLPPACVCIPSGGVPRREHEALLLDTVHDLRPSLIALAGYMRILGEDFLTHVGVPILNIHPSLLPDFPGLHAQKQAWDAGVERSGATVHQVDAGVDTGPIVMQEEVARRVDDDLDSFSARILEAEHRLYPRALQHFIDTTLGR